MGGEGWLRQLRDNSEHTVSPSSRIQEGLNLPCPTQQTLLMGGSSTGNVAVVQTELYCSVRHWAQASWGSGGGGEGAMQGRRGCSTEQQCSV